MQTQVVKAELRLGACSEAPVPVLDAPAGSPLSPAFPWCEGRGAGGLALSVRVGRPCWRGALGRKPLLCAAGVGKVGGPGHGSLWAAGKGGLELAEDVGEKCK